MYSVNKKYICVTQILKYKKSNFPNSYILQIFPMNVKVSAGTLVTVTNWACGWIITFTFNLLMQWNASGKYSFDVYMFL